MDWQNWRLKSGKFTWRVAVPGDALTLEGLMMTMDRRLGEQDRPPFFDTPTLITLVAEDSEGVVRGGVYLGAIVEVAFIGMSRDVFLSSSALTPTLVEFAVSRKFRFSQVVVPRKLKRLLQRLYIAVGYVCTDDDRSHFAMRLPSLSDLQANRPYGEVRPGELH